MKATICPIDRAAANGLQPAGPDHDHHADVDAQGQDRRHGGHELHHLDGTVGEIFVGRFEALAFEIGAHEGLDQVHAGDIFLQDGVQPVQLLLHGPEERLHVDDEEDDDDRGDQQQRQHGQRQAAAGADHQDQAADHQQRRARADAQGDLRQAS